MRNINYKKKGVQAQVRISACKDMLEYVSTRGMYLLAAGMTKDQLAHLSDILRREEVKAKRQLRKAKENMGGVDMAPLMKQKSAFIYSTIYHQEPHEPLNLEPVAEDKKIIRSAAQV